MRSGVQRTILRDGKKTSVNLEDAFWTELKEIARLRGVTRMKLITEINAARERSNLSSAIRIFVLEHFQNKAKRAGLPQSGIAIVSSDESQSTPAWRVLYRSIALRSKTCSKTLVS